MKASAAFGFCWSLALASDANAQSIGQGHSDLVSPWRVVLAFAFCVLLAVFAAFALRRRFGSGSGLISRRAPEARIRIVEQRYLGSQRSIFLIEIDEKCYAVLFGPHTASLLPLEKDLAESKPEFSTVTEDADGGEGE